MTSEEKWNLCAKHHYSAAYAHYWMGHQKCEVVKCKHPPTWPHHIKTRGSGGTDYPDNLLALCEEHHREIHNVGDLRFADVHDELNDKISRMKKRKLPW